MKKSNSILFTLLVFILSFSSCSTDEPTLDGNWEVTSFELDDIEYMNFVDVFTMNFDNGASDNGISNWILDGDETIARYSIENNGSTLVYEDSRFDVTLSNSRLTLDGNLGGTKAIIMAQR